MLFVYILVSSLILLLWDILLIKYKYAHNGFLAFGSKPDFTLIVKIRNN